MLAVIPTVSVLLCVACASFFVDTHFMVGCAVWSFAYTVICNVLRVGGGPSSHDVVDGYPRWVYYMCMLYQVVILPTLAVLDFTRHNDVPFADWALGPARRDDVWNRVLYMSFVGAMLKDFWVYGTMDEWFFILHHIVSVCGCCFVVTIPTHLALFVGTSVQAEVASVFYNVKTLYPSTTTRLIHITFMSLSNFGGGVAALYFALEADAKFMSQKVIFSVITALLVLVRCGGVVYSAREISHPEKVYSHTSTLE
eukprot:PhM_4_TR19056/c0_g1_i1/m.3219